MAVTLHYLLEPLWLPARVTTGMHARAVLEVSEVVLTRANLLSRALKLVDALVLFCIVLGHALGGLMVIPSTVLEERLLVLLWIVLLP